MKEKKKKLNLDELKVQSFVTSFDSTVGETAEIKGGYSESCGGGCGGDGPLSVIDGCATFEFTCGGACSNEGGGNC